MHQHKSIYKNELILGEKNIEYIFKSLMPKCEIMNMIDYKYIYSNVIRCFQNSHGMSSKIESEYKIAIDNENRNLDLIIFDILKSTQSCLTNKSILLKIHNNNKYQQVINVLSKLDYFECIIFNKKFNTCNYHELKNMIGVKYVIYKNMWNENLAELPPNLNLVKINIKQNTSKLYTIPHGIENISIYENYNKICKHTITNLNNLNNLNKICNILLINDETTSITKYNKNNFEYLCCLVKNDFIDFNNLPNCIEILELWNNFDKSLDYLPNTITRIIFNGDIMTKLYNLPSSIKEIYFNDIKSAEIFKKIIELPNFIETIYFNFNSYKDIFYLCPISIPLKDNPIALNLLQLPSSIKNIYVINYQTNGSISGNLFLNIMRKIKTEKNKNYIISEIYFNIYLNIYLNKKYI